jgi:periplasmic protein CpxP/Spy
MYFMKKLVLVAFILSATLGFSQEKKAQRADASPEERANIQVKKLKTELELNEKQEEKVKTIIVTQIKQFDVIKENIKKKRLAGEKPTVDDIKKANDAREANEANLELELKKILTKEQLAKYEQKKEERKALMKERMKQKQASQDADVKEDTK